MTHPTSFNLGKWTRLTFYGWLVGIVLIILLSSLFDLIGLEGFQFFIGIGMGAGVGFFQHRYLKKELGPIINWFSSSLIGLSVPFLLTDLIFHFVEVPGMTYYLPVSVIAGAIVVTLLQFNVLKNVSSNARPWIVGGVLSWAFAMGAVLSIDYIKLILHNNWLLFSINLTLILGGGIVLGLTSGFFLRRITMHNS